MDGRDPEAVTIIESVDDGAIDRESETPVDGVALSFVSHRSERSGVTAERLGKITSRQDDGQKRVPRLGSDNDCWEPDADPAVTHSTDVGKVLLDHLAVRGGDQVDLAPVVFVEAKGGPTAGAGADPVSGISSQIIGSENSNLEGSMPTPGPAAGETESPSRRVRRRNRIGPTYFPRTQE